MDWKPGSRLASLFTKQFLQRNVVRHAEQATDKPSRDSPHCELYLKFKTTGLQSTVLLGLVIGPCEHADSYPRVQPLQACRKDTPRRVCKFLPLGVAMFWNRGVRRLQTSNTFLGKWAFSPKDRETVEWPVTCYHLMYHHFARGGHSRSPQSGARMIKTIDLSMSHVPDVQGRD
jgi:hypothetical protein